MVLFLRVQRYNKFPTAQILFYFLDLCQRITEKGEPLRLPYSIFLPFISLAKYT
jgi:hypothetical protein